MNKIGTINASIPKPGPMYVKPKGVIQPITLAEPSFLYQLDAPLEEGGNNLWSGCLNPNNGHDPAHLAKAVKLFLAAEDLLAALKGITSFIEAVAEGRQITRLMVVDFATATEPNSSALLRAAQAAIAKADQ